jgi:HPr kinase/phosphorylase
VSTSDDNKKVKRTSVSVGTFMEVGGRDLEMELVAGSKGLKRRIPEVAIHRPGLALTGFYNHFAEHRIQVLGMAEWAYLLSLTEEERTMRLRRFFECKLPCVILGRSKRPFPEMVELAEEFRTPVLRSRMITKHLINAATIIMENLSAPRAKAQGTMLEIQGIGVLIEGKPGMGKSETALALIRRGGALVSDDVTALRLDSAGAVMASAVDVTRFHMEIRGVGIVHVPSLFGVSSVRGEKLLELVVTLCRPGECELGGANLYAHGTRPFLGVEIPRVHIPIAPGRDIANVVEAAALDHKLRMLGHDAEKELDENLMALLQRGRNGSE